MGHDPAGWLAVHPETGLVTAQGHLDRESPFVKNSTYIAVLLAVDDGEAVKGALVLPPPREGHMLPSPGILAPARSSAGGCLSPLLLGASPSP